MNDYQANRREEMLHAIKPICEVFNIKTYDYYFNDNGVFSSEILKLNDTLIGCSCNSVFAVKQEVLGYIFATQYERNFGKHDIYVKDIIKRNWMEKYRPR